MFAGILCTAVMGLMGCGGQNAAPGSSAATGTVVPAGGAADGLVVTFDTEPNPPAKGTNALRVRVTRPDGSPVTTGTVTTVFSMPAMPSMNMPAMRSEVTLQHEGDGRYSGTGELSMGGTWNVAIRVVEGSADPITRNTSIVAKE
jgi:Cu(I)/Ag(I) efflux system membrane fusion protein/cobalt-zinc-cadmium efflux system membrane fusion protein